MCTCACTRECLRVRAYVHISSRPPNDTLCIFQKQTREQAQWLYLEPIFASDDIKKQMPVESEKFGAVDRVFKITVSKCIENPKVLIFTRTDGLLDDLKKAFDDLEVQTRVSTRIWSRKGSTFHDFSSCPTMSSSRFSPRPKTRLACSRISKNALRPSRSSTSTTSVSFTA